MPGLSDRDRRNPHQEPTLLCRLGYALSRDLSHKVADQVAYQLIEDNTGGNHPRSEDFRADVELPAGGPVRRWLIIRTRALTGAPMGPAAAYPRGEQRLGTHPLLQGHLRPCSRHGHRFHPAEHGHADEPAPDIHFRSRWSFLSGNTVAHGTRVTRQRFGTPGSCLAPMDGAS